MQLFPKEKPYDILFYDHSNASKDKNTNTITGKRKSDGYLYTAYKNKKHKLGSIKVSEVNKKKIKTVDEGIYDLLSFFTHIYCIFFHVLPFV